MAHHKSAKKRIRQSATRRLRNRYQAKTMRNALRAIRAMKEQTEAQKAMPGIVSMMDKLVKTNLIHKNKAGNLKSKLAKFVNKLSEAKAEKAPKATKKKATTTKSTAKKAK